jgi:hypothetical protein
MRTITRKSELISGSKRQWSREVKVGTHGSRLELDLNVGGINAFVEDRQRELVFGFIKFVSISAICKYLYIRRNFAILTWESTSCTSDLGDQGEKRDGLLM